MKINIYKSFTILLLFNFNYSSSCFAQDFTFDSKVVADTHIADDHLGHFGGNAIFGDYMVAGAHFRDYSGGGISVWNSGAAFLYHWNEESCQWEQIDIIYAESAVGVLDLEASSQFGSAVAIENDLIAIGAFQYDGPSDNSGIVYIYRIVADEAIFVERLLPFTNALTPDSEANANFGIALKMHGGQLIVGATNESQADGLPTMSEAGAAYIYKWDAFSSSFQFSNKLTANDRYPFHGFGNEVSIFGNYAVVAAELNSPGSGGPIPNSGAVYIYEKNAVTGIWSQTQKIIAFDRDVNDRFGSSVDMTQMHIIVGARLEDPSDGVIDINDAGSSYIYKWNGFGLYLFEQKINSSDFMSDDNFGQNVAISNYNILVGAPFHDLDEDGINSITNAGAAYLFSYDGIMWTQTQKLDAFDRRSDDNFGEALSIHEKRIMIGTPFNDLNAYGDLFPIVSQAGAVYIFGAESKPIINDIFSDQIGSCNDLPFDLHVSGVLYDGYEWEWHEGSCDGPTIATGETINVNPTETTTYCVRANGCFNYVEPEDCECIEVEVKTGNWHQTTLAGSKEDGNDIVTDNVGNVYVTGSYQGYAMFDGGENSNVTISAFPSYTPIFKSYVAKYDNCANLMWVAYSEGNETVDLSNGIAINSTGSTLYIVGEFENQIVFNHGLGDFGFGAGSITTTRPGKNGYIARIDTETGEIDYINAVWSDGASSNLTAITINENNNRIIVAGQTYNTPGLEKIFIRKYVPTYLSIGASRFHLQSSAYNGAIINALDYDEDSPLGSGEYGSFWAIGDFKSSFYITSYGGAPFSTLNSSATEREAFVLKYYDHTAGIGAVSDIPHGVFLKKGNIVNIGGNSMTGMDVAIDKATGNGYLIGTKRGENLAAFGLLGHDLPNPFNRLVGYFVGMRYDGGVAPGSLAQISQPGSPFDNYGNGVIVVEDKVYFTGSRTSQTRFYDGLPYSSLTYTGLNGLHLYVVAYNLVDGSFAWANGTKNNSLIEQAYHGPQAICTDGLGHLFITGNFRSGMNYIYGTPASGDLYYTSNGGTLFTMRVDIEGASETALQSPNFFWGGTENKEVIPLADSNESTRLILFPNPTSIKTQIKLYNHDPKKIYFIKVFSLDGRIIYEGNLSSANLLLDCSDFANGIYTILVTDNINTYTEKLIISK